MRVLVLVVFAFVQRSLFCKCTVSVRVFPYLLGMDGRGLYSLKTGKLVHPLRYTSYVSALTPDGRFLFSGRCDGSIRMNGYSSSKGYEPLGLFTCPSVEALTVPSPCALSLFHSHFLSLHFYLFVCLLSIAFSIAPISLCLPFCWFSCFKALPPKPLCRGIMTILFSGGPLEHMRTIAWEIRLFGRNPCLSFSPSNGMLENTTILHDCVCVLKLFGYITEREREDFADCVRKTESHTSDAVESMGSFGYCLNTVCVPPAALGEQRCTLSGRWHSRGRGVYLHPVRQLFMCAQYVPAR